MTIKPTERRPHEGVSARRAPDYWVLEGIPLKEMLSRLHDIQKERIELPPSLDDGRRYDFLLVLPQRESRETVDRLMREGIEKYFRIRVAAEVRDMDVYVLTAPNGAISATRTSLDEPGSFGWVDIQTPASAPDNFIGFSDPPWHRDGDRGADGRRAQQDGGRVSQESGRRLEARHGIDPRDVGDEHGGATVRDARSDTGSSGHRRNNLDGAYDLSIRTQAESGEQFLHALCDRLGLAATPARRHVTMLVVRDGAHG